MSCLLWLQTQCLTAASPVGATPGRSTPLHKAASSGDLAALAALTESEQLDARDQDGLTPLHHALERGHLAAAALLVDRGADVNARDPEGNTPLHRVLLTGPTLIQSVPPPAWLKRKEAEPGKRASVGYLLEHAEDPSMVRAAYAAAFLLAAGADPKATNHAGETILELAVSEDARLFEEERSDLLRLLGQSGKRLLDRRDSKGETLLHRAARGFDVEVVADLIAAGADVNATNRQGRTPLHAAVEKVNLWPGPLLEILKAKPQVNARDIQGMTPLHVLALSDSSFAEEAAEALLQAGADPNARDKRGRTPVHLCLTGEIPWEAARQCLPLLVRAGADLAARDADDRTPLHYLAALGEHQPLFFIRGIADLFVAAKVDMEARDKLGDTPLHLAARHGTRDVFDWLLEQGANLDATNRAGETPRALAARSESPFRISPTMGETSVFEAARQGNMPALEKMLRADPVLVNRTNEVGQTPLRVAVLAGRTNVVAFLEAKGARWDALSAVHAGRADALRAVLARGSRSILQSPENRELLHLAATRGDAEVARILLEAGCDPRAPNAAGLSALGLARLHNRSDVAEVLARAGAELTVFGAVCLGDLEAFSAMLARDPLLLSAVNPAGFSAAEVAVAHGQTPILEEMLARGVSPNLTNLQTAMTLLHVAAVADQPACAWLLLRRGANANCLDAGGMTPLHWATIRGSTGMVSVLIQHGADPNAAISGTRPETSVWMPTPWLAGNTPLHLAVSFARADVVEQLLKAGARVNARDRMGYTPLDLANPMPRPMIQMHTGFALRRLESGLGLQLTSLAGLASREHIQQAQAKAALLEKAGGQRTPRMPTDRAPNFSPMFPIRPAPNALPLRPQRELTNTPAPSP